MTSVPPFSEVEQLFAHARAGLTPRHRDHLHELGVPRPMVDTFGLVGCARVVPVSDYAFDFAPGDEGTAAYIVAARGVGDFVANAERTSALVDPVRDLVAFAPSRPHQWRIYYGVVPLLGALTFGGRRLTPVWPTPLDWLRSGARGVVILDRRIVERPLVEVMPQSHADVAFRRATAWRAA